MNRRKFLTLASAALVAATPAYAVVVESVVRQLRDQGYGSIRVSRTLLGRIRILAERPGERREIILHRGTGEILRDFSTAIRAPLIRSDDDENNDGGPGRSGDSDSRGGSSGGSDDDDDDDDDDGGDSGGGGGDDDDGDDGDDDDDD